MRRASVKDEENARKFSHDVFFKMSKKIAQLTKVIFYLHSKQDDHNVEIGSLKDSYEHEIERVLVVNALDACALYDILDYCRIQGFCFTKGTETSRIGV